MEEAVEFILEELQFGHDLTVVENGHLEVNKNDLWLLQFGHDLTVVENICSVIVCLLLSSLQFGHDLTVVENFQTMEEVIFTKGRFNLATTSRSWRTIVHK